MYLKKTIFSALTVALLSSCLSLPSLLPGSDEPAEADLVQLKEITISNHDYCIRIPAGASLQLNVESRPDSPQNYPYTWHSAAPEIVQVDQKGTMTARETGITHVSVSLPARYDYYSTDDTPMEDSVTVLVYNDTNLHRIDPPTIDKSAHFGEELALSADGNTLLICAPGLGKVFLYERDGEEFTLKTTFEGRADISRGFGESASLSADGSRAAVGSIGDNASGAVYLYAAKGDSWALETVIEGPAVEGDRVKNYFGWTVALNNAGTELWAAAPYEEGPGRIHIYRLEEGEWRENQILKPETDRNHNRYMFGYSIDIGGDDHFAIVGVPSADRSRAAGKKSGRIYTYEKKGNLWVPTYQNGLAGSVADHRYGHSVAATGDSSLFFSGIPHLGRGNSGGVEVFDRQAGPIILTLDRLYVHQDFGQSVSASEDGSKLLVGVAAFSGEGMGLLFDQHDGKWRQLTGLSFITPPSEKKNFPSLGKSTALSADGSVAVVGAPEDDTHQRDAGCVYYRLLTP